MLPRLPRTLGCAVVLAVVGCGQTAVANHTAGQAGQQAQAVVQAAAPVPTATPAPTPPPPTPTPAPTPPPTPPPPAIALAFGASTVTVSVSGIANGGHQVHVHRDCTGNPNLHVTTLGTEFVGPDGTGSATFSLPASLRGRGLDLLVYPLGASQGPPSLCAAV
jgi:hypothetical protein